MRTHLCTDLYENFVDGRLLPYELKFKSLKSLTTVRPNHNRWGLSQNHDADADTEMKNCIHVHQKLPKRPKIVGNLDQLGKI